MIEQLLLIPLFTGFVFTVMAAIMLKFPPKTINAFYGYRTGSSMKSKPRWDFAQVYASKEMIRIGVVLMLLSLLGLGVGFDQSEPIISLSFVIAGVVILFVRVERAIKREFKGDGL